MILKWEKLEINRGSSYQCRWVLKKDGVAQFIVEKFKDDFYTTNPYKVFDIRGSKSNMVKLFWKSEVLCESAEDAVGTIKNAKRYAESVVIGGK